MLENLKRLISEESYKTAMEEAAEQITTDDDDIKDAFLDDIETMVVGSEEDPEIKKIVDDLPEVADEVEPVSQKDIEKMVESYVPETIIGGNKISTESLIENDFSDLGMDQVITESDFIDFETDIDSLLEGCDCLDEDDDDEDYEDSEDEDEEEFGDDEEEVIKDHGGDDNYGAEDDIGIEESELEDIEIDLETALMMTSLMESSEDEEDDYEEPAISSDYHYFDNEDDPAEDQPVDESDAADENIVDDVDIYDDDIDDFI